MKMRITVEGVSYDVEVEVLEDDGAHVTSTRRAPIPGPAAHKSASPSAPLAPPPPGSSSGGGASSASGKQVKSPIAGMVQSLSVKAGDAVQVNDTLLVLEAMKMESSVASPVAGKVKRVLVEAGQAVRMGDVLVELE